MNFTEEEAEALMNTRLVKYYKDYVEPLEKECDALMDEVEKLKYENKRLKMHNTAMKNKMEKQKMANSDVNNETDCVRYRNQAVDLKKKLDDSRLLVDKKDREIVSLKIENYKLRDALTKKGGK